MNCKKVQDLILIDYIDGEMSQKQKTELQAHLASCEDCRAFVHFAQKSAVDPFVDMKELAVPHSIWLNVKESIVTGQKDPSPAADIWEKLKSLFSIPKPALAFATVMMLILMVGTFNPSRVSVTNDAKEQEYFAYLSDGDQPLGDEEGFNTSVEQYFL